MDGPTPTPPRPSDAAASLSQRERDVLEGVRRGQTNPEVAAALGVSVHTVKFHLASAYRKLGATNRTEAIARWLAADAGGAGSARPAASAQPAPPAERPGTSIDLQRYWAVARRFRGLIIGGLAVGFLLAVLAYTSLGAAPRYRSTATVFITQPGFPAGRAVQQFLPGDQASGRPSVPVADTERLANLTSLYAQLAMSDPVRRRLTASEGSEGKVTVTAVPAPAYATPAILPLLRFSATAPSPGRAVALADAATGAFGVWLRGQQQASGIPDDRRVISQRVSGGSKPVQVAKRSVSLAVIVFLGFASGAFGLAMALENLRPRPDRVAVDPDEDELALAPPASNGHRPAPAAAAVPDPAP
jgi:DNA-binding CsgD family transcriptional regulator